MYIYKAGVIGAGAMGAEIAQVITYSGLPVVLRDVNDELVQKGIEKIRTIYQRRVDKGKMAASEVEQKMALVRGTTQYEDFKDVDVVIEAVPEKMDMKKKVFQEVEAHLSGDAILASNTSALSISELGAATKRPEKVIGMHFFYPAHVMKLVEIIPGLATSEEVVEDMINFTESLRKIPVKVNECGGFLVNRLLMPYLNEAAYCLQEGAATVEEIDKAAVAFGFPMGPFTLVDNLGLDICVDVVGTLLEAYGQRMKPAEVLTKMYEQKRFGKKTGVGFYEYGGKNAQPLEELIKSLKPPAAAGKSEFTTERLIYPMINEAATCVEEHVARESDIDLAMVAGVGFPQEKEGVLHYADQVGLDKILNTLTQLHKTHGERFFPSARIRRMVGAHFWGRATGRGFFEYST